MSRYGSRNMELNFEKYSDGLIPAIIQDAATGRVLMLGFMNEAAVTKTREAGLVTFFSRSRRKLWTKGETSGNYLHIREIFADCDNDTLLVKATPDGPACHKGTETCFDENNVRPALGVLEDLERLIADRRDRPQEGSYTSKLFARGKAKIAQKVGEEAVELVIEAITGNTEKFKSEAADLLFHFLVLLRAEDVSLKDVLRELEARRGNGK